MPNKSLSIAVVALLCMICNAWGQVARSAPADPAPNSVRFAGDMGGNNAPQLVRIHDLRSTTDEDRPLDDPTNSARWTLTAAASETPDRAPLPVSTDLTNPLGQRPTHGSEPAIPQENVQWRSLIRSSAVMLGVMNGFRIATEPSTRNALDNEVVGGYFDALGSMHGWSDGDVLYENYLGHPIQGAATAYLWTNHDPRYRYVEFGRDRDYWMSRLRAYAFAWAFSEQFEIGLVSEATIGQIQRYCCAYGFVDHVVTPNFGMGWVIGLDVLDKYVTRKIEDRTQNAAYRRIVRVALNPQLAFANVMSFHKPWRRENRPGVHEYDGELYPRPPRPNIGRFERPLNPVFELSAATPFGMLYDNQYCIGGGGIGAFRLSPSWQWTLEVSGCTLGDSLPSNWSGDSLTFSTGPQWSWRSRSRLIPRLAFRVGGQKVTEQYSDPVLKEQVLSTLPPGVNPKDVYYDYVTPYESTGVMLSVSGGVDFQMNSALALRIGNVDYIHSWLAQLNGTDFNNAVRFSTGLVLSVGTW